MQTARAQRSGSGHDRQTPVPFIINRPDGENHIIFGNFQRRLRNVADRFAHAPNPERWWLARRPHTHVAPGSGSQVSVESLSNLAVSSWTFAWRRRRRCQGGQSGRVQAGDCCHIVEDSRTSSTSPYSMPFSVRMFWCWWLKSSRYSVKRTAANPCWLKE